MKKIVCFTIISVVILFSIYAHAAQYVLTISLYNQDGTPASGVTFPGTDTLVLGGNLWITSPQYIKVTYSSPETYWSIRIISKNNEIANPLYPNPLSTGNDGTWEWTLHPEWGGKYKYENGNWQIGDDMVSYGGLIDPATKNDPGMRALLAWQVFKYNDPYYPDNVRHDPPLFPVPPSTALNDGTVGGGPVDSWAYLGDVADTGYVNDPTNDYFWVAYGSGGFSLLAQHPVVYRDSSNNPLPKPGGGQIIIYLGARFGYKAETLYGMADVSVLPAGNYTARLYLELIHE